MFSDTEWGPANTETFYTSLLHLMKHDIVVIENFK